MGAPLHIVQLNPAYAAGENDPAALLARYGTLTGWARSLRDAGAAVTVVQRFPRDASIVEDDVSYIFAGDDAPPLPRPSWRGETLAARVAALRPDIVHLNGLMFHGLAAALRRTLPDRTAIVAQDHAGYSPRWQLPFVARRWRAGFRALDACSFTDAAQADPWRAAGWLRDTPVLSILESSTTIGARPREEARTETGVRGTPSIVWIGRLDANKDPLTVLDALDRAFDRLPEARACMLYHEAPLEAEVHARLLRSPRLVERVTMVGAVPHDRVASYLSAADLFVSGSHREGSGYALIEAMACGAVPVVTDIPSFRAIAGDLGERWTPGSAAECTDALIRTASTDLDAGRNRAILRFTNELSWRAIGVRTLEIYTTLLERRRAAG